ncbi:MAG: DUF4910 domain-containing protein [Pyrinomonadaceae bacterium]
MTKNTGSEMHELCRRLFPICRSITGEGLRRTLDIISEYLPGLEIFNVPSGEKCFDWEVPDEWNIRDAYIIAPNGEKIIDFQKSNLHVVGYSVPVNKKINLEELQNHLYSLPEQPDAIPYITSYYRERWGFCLTDNQRKNLAPGEYTVVIDSDLKPGNLTYGELILKGESEKEIFLSTYVCHPSMGNNELSGPAVTTFITQWLSRLENRKFTYRIVFIPETIGSVVYLSRNLEKLKKNVFAGFVLTCIGDERNYSYLSSRTENTPSDKIALHVLKNMQPGFIRYSFLERGSDERQYCSPNVNLPMASLMRTKYGEYPEYHTSRDDLTLITPDGLMGGFDVVQKCLECLERNEKLRTTVCGEPQLGKRGLYPTLGTKENKKKTENLMNLLAYADGTLTLLEIAEKINVPMWDLFENVELLKKEKLLQNAD